MSFERLNDIKEKALSFGFCACGVCRAEHVDEQTEQYFRTWLNEGKEGTMDYLSRNIDKRLDPRLLMEGTKSIICVAMSYKPSRYLPEESYQIAYYAYGEDYHNVMKRYLHRLAAALSLNRYRALVDTAPILDRYWAVRAGLGFIGHNRQLIVPHYGSMCYLGEILTEEDIPSPTTEQKEYGCRSCHACIDACPTHALTTTGIDANRCLSYQTIEHPGELSDEAKSCLGNCFFGCDRCQLACPYNRHAPASTIQEFQPSPELFAMTKSDWQHLTFDKYAALFKTSAVKRAKYEGLMRNIHALINNNS